jgi:hypothetical protein
MWKMLPEEEQARAGSYRVPSDLERIACFRLDKNRIGAIRFLQRHTRDDEVVFQVSHDMTKFLLTTRCCISRPNANPLRSGTILIRGYNYGDYTRPNGVGVGKQKTSFRRARVRLG